jgi:hypothetical protein
MMERIASAPDAAAASRVSRSLGMMVLQGGSFWTRP